MNIKFDFIWIPRKFGGHLIEPYLGMRTTIRWQRYINEYLQCSRSIQWQFIDFDSRSQQGQAICCFASDDFLPETWFEEGELIEILDGYRVIAIGCLTK